MSFYDLSMNVVYMEYFILKSPVPTFEVSYKNMELVKNDHKLSVHRVKFQFIGDFNDYMMKITFTDIFVVWIQRDASYRRTKAYAKNDNTQMW